MTQDVRCRQRRFIIMLFVIGTINLQSKWQFVFGPLPKVYSSLRKAITKLKAELTWEAKKLKTNLTRKSGFEHSTPPQQWIILKNFVQFQRFQLLGIMSPSSRLSSSLHTIPSQSHI